MIARAMLDSPDYTQKRTSVERILDGLTEHLVDMKTLQINIDQLRESMDEVRDAAEDTDLD